MKPEELTKEEKRRLTMEFFRIQGYLDRLDLPLYEMHGFILMYKDVLFQLPIEWTEVFNKWKSWKRMLEEMLEALKEAREKALKEEKET
ncbi:MAG: hypothetical protein DRJ67_05180 [Thermoprotei archaeon]|nr:MAG: hypothetical protein DRJ67_05180 [Thermoprotei archaeon]